MLNFTGKAGEPCRLAAWAAWALVLTLAPVSWVPREATAIIPVVEGPRSSGLTRSPCSVQQEQNVLKEPKEQGAEGQGRNRKK